MTTRQEAVWMEWVANPKLFTGGTWAPCDLPFKPLRVYTLFNETDKSKPPTLPIKPVHRQNCFYEDWVHDWNFHQGKFRYYTRVMNCGVWILIEYEE